MFQPNTFEHFSILRCKLEFLLKSLIKKEKIWHLKIYFQSCLIFTVCFYWNFLIFLHVLMCVPAHGQTHRALSSFDRWGSDTTLNAMLWVKKQSNSPLVSCAWSSLNSFINLMEWFNTSFSLVCRTCKVTAKLR